MKILWFTNNECGSILRKSNKVTYGGWLFALEKEIKKYSNSIELHICYISKIAEDSFEFDGVYYHPVFRSIPSNAIKRIISRRKTQERDEKEILPQLLNAVKCVQPDLIHIHGTEECFGLIQDYISSIPIVFSIQGLIAPYLEKYFSGLPQECMQKHEPWHKKIRGISYINGKRSFQHRAKRELHYLENAKYIIGRTLFDHRLPHLCNSEVKIFQGEEILREEFYTKNNWNKNAFGNPLQIVSTISGGIYKGFETALHAASLLIQYAKFDFTWTIIGYERNNEWVRIAEKFKHINSDECNIRFIGRKDAKQMQEVLLGSDIYVQVSHIENSPNSLCEAMLLGIPIVASFAGGTSSMLEDREEGLLVQDGEPYSLAGAIVEITQDFETAKKRAQKARERAAKRHNPQNICTMLIDTYDKILKDFSSGNK